MTDEQIAQWFTYQECSENDIDAMQRWRQGLSDVATDFCRYVPDENDACKIYALRQLKAAMMAMNAALVAPMPSKSEDDSGPASHSKIDFKDDLGGDGIVTATLFE